MEKHIIKLDTTKKNLSVKLIGKFGNDDVGSFVQAFTNTVKLIKPAECTLTFDAKELQVSQQEMLPMLENCFGLYKSIGFKKIYMNMGDNVVLKMQVNRIARKSGLTNCEVI